MVLVVVDDSDYKAIPGTYIGSAAMTELSMNPFESQGDALTIDVDIDPSLKPMISMDLDYQGSHEFMINLNGHNIVPFAKNMTGVQSR